MDSISQSLFLVLSLLLPFRLSPFILMDRGRLTDLHGFRRPGVYVCVYIYMTIYVCMWRLVMMITTTISTAVGRGVLDVFSCAISLLRIKEHKINRANKEDR